MDDHQTKTEVNHEELMAIMKASLERNNGPDGCLGAMEIGNKCRPK
jgi:hypothetical protein